jgi:general secretion pathway protein K
MEMLHCNFLANPINKQRGAAIIVALFIAALIAAISMCMMQYLQIDLRRTELILRANQGYYYTQGSIAWAKDILIQNWKQHKPNQIVDHLPLNLRPSQEGPYRINATLTDLQGRFNINSMTTDAFQKAFLRLMRLVDPTIDQNNAQDIVKGIIDWISPGIKESTFDAYYLKLNPPYRAAHNPMTSISELLLVKGVTPNLFTKLSPYLTALPDKTQININTAPALVIMSLNPTMPIHSAQSIVSLLKKEPVVDLQKLAALPLLKNNPIPSELITVMSNYFLLKTNVTVEDQQLILYTIFNRLTKDLNAKVTIIWQSKGTL